MNFKQKEEKIYNQKKRTFLNKRKDGDTRYKIFIKCKMVSRNKTQEVTQNQGRLSFNSGQKMADDEDN